MPREMIGNTDGPDGFNVKVGWSHGHDVQVGVEDDAERSMFWGLLAGDAERLGAEMRRIVAEANEPGTQPLGDQAIGYELLNALDTITPHYRGLWSTLSRQQVNDLIRVLRRARDQAYGRDE